MPSEHFSWFRDSARRFAGALRRGPRSAIRRVFGDRAMHGVRFDSAQPTTRLGTVPREMKGTDMREIDWDAMAKATPPSTLRLACGCDVPHEVGVRVFNYYDHKAGVIEHLATHAQPDTSGLLPGGYAWWVDVRQDDGSITMVDGSRMCCIATAIKRGWHSMNDEPM